MGRNFSLFARLFTYSADNLTSPSFFSYKTSTEILCPPLRFVYLWDMTFLSVQPLMDNLEAQTYETFEKDVVKYTQVPAI